MDDRQLAVAVLLVRGFCGRPVQRQRLPERRLDLPHVTRRQRGSCRRGRALGPGRRALTSQSQRHQQRELDRDHGFLYDVI